MNKRKRALLLIVVVLTLLIFGIYYLIYLQPIFKEHHKSTLVTKVDKIIMDYDPPNRTGMFLLDLQIRMRYDTAIFFNAGNPMYLNKKKVKVYNVIGDTKERVSLEDLEIGDTVEFGIYSFTSYGGNVYDAFEINILE